METYNRREAGDADRRDQEDDPQVQLREKPHRQDFAPARERTGGSIAVRSAPPVEDFVHRVRLPTLNEPREGQRDDEPEHVESTRLRNGDGGAEGDRRVRPQEDWDHPELEEPPEGLPLSPFSHAGNYRDSNIRRYCNRSF